MHMQVIINNPLKSLNRLSNTEWCTYKRAASHKLKQKIKYLKYQLCHSGTLKFNK